MNLSEGDEMLLLRDTFKETIFTETDLQVITGIFLIVGVVLNVTLIFLSVNRVGEGVTSNFVTLAFLDILNLMLLLPEILYVNHRNWKFSEKLCTVYLGVECIINISILYVTIMTNLQVIASINVHQLVKSDSFDDGDELDEHGYQILGNYEATSTEKPVYYPKRSSFTVFFVLVMILAVSVAFPFFLYAQKDPLAGMDSSICVMRGLNDPIFNTVIAVLVIFVRILLPTMLLICTTFTLFVKYQRIEDEILENPIKIALTLSIIVVICSLQRTFGSLLFEIYSAKQITSTGINKPFTQFKYPHVENNFIAISLTLTHYLSSLVRPFAVLMIQYCCCCRRRKVKTVNCNSSNEL
ncbi:uncharacterized protein LOC134830394 [Culicoides brevitarsis]|uniref:uncharacterized protein LOC134830394 n=1 Tax=Culicoides brevitarsis TaxID=469753 RepID=UPI00307BA9C2